MADKKTKEQYFGLMGATLTYNDRKQFRENFFEFIRNTDAVFIDDYTPVIDQMIEKMETPRDKVLASSVVIRKINDDDRGGTLRKSAFKHWHQGLKEVGSIQKVNEILALNDKAYWEKQPQSLKDAAQKVWDDINDPSPIPFEKFSI